MNNKIHQIAVQKISFIQIDIKFLSKYLVVLLLLLSFQNSFSQKVNKEIKTKPITVMSFNIRYGSADDGDNSWQFRKNYLFDIIKKTNPDLLGLQEALTFQIEEILRAVPGYELIGVGRDDGKKAGEYSCILYKKSRLELDTTETFWFSDTPTIPGSKTWGNNFPRVCTWGKFLDSKVNKYFYYYNLHIDHESQPSREKSTEMLVKKMKNQKEKLPIILTGDFNCGDDNQAINNVIHSGLIDTYRKKHSKTNNEGTFNNFKNEINGERIDFIFVSKDFAIADSKIIRDTYYGKNSSDHFPVAAKIKLR